MKTAKKKNAKKIFISIIVLILMCSVAAIITGFIYIKNQSAALDSADNVKTLNLKIESGNTARDIANKLYINGIIKNADVFYLFARFPTLGKFVFADKGVSKNVFTIKTGVCNVKSTMDAAEIYKALSAGVDEQIQVAIPEGLTITKIAERLQNADVCNAQEFIDAAHDRDFLRSIDVPFATAEGYLFPDTYSFVPNSSGKTCVSAMVKNFFEKTGGIKNLASAPLEERNRIVILASVIEREYRAADEAPLIASVFTNRIKNNIGLYSCATVEYVITEVLGRPHPDIITFADLEIESPYNTYLHAGLPPAPISNPGLVALNAAANPAKSDYFYFRLMDEEEGRHVFTKTLEEHEKQNQIFKTKKLSR